MFWIHRNPDRRVIVHRETACSGAERAPVPSGEWSGPYGSLAEALVEGLSRDAIVLRNCPDCFNRQRDDGSTTWA